MRYFAWNAIPNRIHENDLVDRLGNRSRDRRCEVDVASSISLDRCCEFDFARLILRVDVVTVRSRNRYCEIDVVSSISRSMLPYLSGLYVCTQ